MLNSVASYDRERDCFYFLVSSVVGERWDVRLGNIHGGGDLRCSVKDIREATLRTTPDALEHARSTAGDKIRRMALTHLVSGNFNKSISLLKEAISRQPNAWYLYNDLAACYFAKSIEDSQPYDLLPAFNAINSAFKLSRDPAVLFNRAILLERLSLRQEALSAWTAYLLAKITKDWDPALEKYRQGLGYEAERFPAERVEKNFEKALANNDLECLAPEVSKKPQEVRIFIEDKLLTRWAQAEIDDRGSDAKALRKSALLVSRLLARHNDDELLVEATQAIEHAGRNERAALVKAHLAYGAARKSFKERDIKGALDAFSFARENFNIGHSPMAAWAEFFEAACSYLNKNYVDGAQRLIHLRKRVEGQPYHALIGRIDWLLGLIYLEQMDPGKAKLFLEASTKTFRRIGELSNYASTLSLTAHSLELVGEIRAAWKLRHESLRAAFTAMDEERLSVILGESVRAALAEGELDIALVIQNEALRLDLLSGNPLAIAESYWRRARIKQKLGADEAALFDLGIALKKCHYISSQNNRNQIMAGILVTEGAALRSSDQARSASTITAALDLYGSLGFDYPRGESLLERSKTYSAAGMVDEATADLSEAILLLESRCSNLFDDLQSAFCYEQANQAYAERLLLQLRGNAVAALGAWDEGKGGWLAKKMRTDELSNCSIGTLWECIPQDVAIVEFALLSDQLVAWLVTSQGIQVSVNSIEERQITEKIASFRRALQWESGDLRSRAAELFTIVLGPFARDLRLYSKIMFVPDGALHGLPFSALLDVKAGQLLVQSHRISVAPSVGWYLRMKSKKNLTERQNITVLAIGNPAFSKKDFPFLDNLPGAEKEAAIPTRFFSGSAVVLRERATLDLLNRELPRHGIFHFAGHARLADGLSALSGLLFASDKANNGMLRARDIARMQLENVRVCVLSACKTYMGQEEGGTILETLAYPFLSAGVSSVVATLWNVNDSSASRFFEFFYSNLAKGKAPAEALRSAQLLSFRESGTNYAWATFQMIGVPD
jgi:CHAT domain-containing protein